MTALDPGQAEKLSRLAARVEELEAAMAAVATVLGGIGITMIEYYSGVRKSLPKELSRYERSTAPTARGEP